MLVKVVKNIKRIKLNNMDLETFENYNTAKNLSEQLNEKQNKDKIIKHFLESGLTTEKYIKKLQNDLRKGEVKEPIKISVIGDEMFNLIYPTIINSIISQK